jgi:hypothetical protein
MLKRVFIVIPFIAFVTLITGCATHVRAGYAGPVYVERWGPAEAPYYNRWVIETHRPYRDYWRLHRRDQRAYWAWRHYHR